MARGPRTLSSRKPTPGAADRPRGEPANDLTPKSPAESATEMVQVVLPNDANPLGFILGGTVMHLIDIAGAIAGHRHTRTLLVTAAVDGLQFLHPIKVGDLIILKSRVTCTFRTSLEVAVEVFSEETLTGDRRMTSHAYLTFAAIDRDGHHLPVPPLVLDTDEDRRVADEARGRRAERLRKRFAPDRSQV
jgi:acyl-CoA hydrolase